MEQFNSFLINYGYITPEKTTWTKDITYPSAFSTKVFCVLLGRVEPKDAAYSRYLNIQVVTLTKLQLYGGIHGGNNSIGGYWMAWGV